MSTPEWRAKNREKLREYQRRWHQKNKATRLERARRQRADRRKWYKELKQRTKCQRCPESDWRCLDYHHRDPKAKVMELSNMIAWRVSREKILAEIEKCDVLCANCHRKETIPGV